MIYELTPEQKQHVQDNVRKVINSEAEGWSAEDEHYPLMAMNAAILELDGVEEDDRDTNGWAWDYWQYFRVGEKQFTLSGSGYHGGHGFYPKEEP